MAEPRIHETPAIRGNADDDTFTRWPYSQLEPLILGDLAIFTHSLTCEEWRVTAARPHDDGPETYDPEPATAT